MSSCEFGAPYRLPSLISVLQTVCVCVCTLPCQQKSDTLNNMLHNTMWQGHYLLSCPHTSLLPRLKYNCKLMQGRVCVCEWERCSLKHLLSHIHAPILCFTWVTWWRQRKWGRWGGTFGLVSQRIDGAVQQSWQDLFPLPVFTLTKQNSAGVCNKSGRAQGCCTV